MIHPDEGILVDFLDGALPSGELASVEEHLGGCGTCREGMRLSSSARDAFASLPELPVPAGIAREALS